LCVLMLWNQDKECWYQVDPQSIPEDRFYLVLCEQNQPDVSNPVCNVPDYHEQGLGAGIPRTKNTLCPLCQELLSLVHGKQDIGKKCVDN